MYALVRHPAFGSVWLHGVRFEDGKVVGKAWDDSQAGSSYYPDGYMGEWETMNFPYSCVVKYEIIEPTAQ